MTLTLLLLAPLVGCTTEVCDLESACDDPSCVIACDGDGDGQLAPELGGTDCDDADPTIFTGAVESCNGVDDDCDGAIDDDDTDGDGPDGRSTMWADADGDGHGDATQPMLRCAVGPGVADVSGDCDDTNAAIHPDHLEICDGLDNQCDGLVDADDPAYEAVEIYLDVDGDGFAADSAVSAMGCPGDGWVDQRGDCNDDIAEVFPGAVEACDGLDSDCDGALPADEADVDLDGTPVCADCDDGDPGRSSWHQERCSGIDDDCDGLVDEDDDSVNPYTCGFCPEADSAIVSKTPTVWARIDPCGIDPTATLQCESDRLHRVGWRTDEGVWRDQLLVHLPPGHGKFNDIYREWAAYAGYRVVSMIFPNEGLIEDWCAYAGDSTAVVACRTAGFEDVMYGGSSHPLIDIPPQDSIVSRLTVLLEHLIATYPDLHFDDFLTDAGELRWDRIVVSGWSKGGGQAAYATQAETLRGAIYLSAPAGDDGPDGWLVGGPTPGCSMYGTYHLGDHRKAHYLSAYDALGMSPVPWDIHIDGPVPPLEAQQITQSVDTTTLPGCSPHAYPAQDDCLNDSQLPGYLHMLCGAADQAACVPPG